MQIAMLAAEFTPAKPISCGARWRRGNARAAWGRSGTAGRGAWSNGIRTRIRRTHLQADGRLRRIRFSRKPCRQLCAAGLRQRLDQVPPPRCLSGRLLNSQPMGFYAPSQLVHDARRHGVEVRAVDVTVGPGRVDARAASESDSDVQRRVRLGLDRVERAGAKLRSSASSKPASNAHSTMSKIWRCAPN